jgi:methylmalonyl-CoA mutase, C-terminal domain
VRVLLVQDSTGHSTGYHVIARSLRDAGVEVVLGGVQLAPAIARLAADEAVDAIGYRIMDAAPVPLVARAVHELRRIGLDVPVVVGGIVPAADVARLAELGVTRVFHPGTPLRAITDFFERLGKEGGTPCRA